MKGEEINRADIAASFQEAVIDVLVTKTMQVAKDYNMRQVAIAGGVAANSSLLEAMSKACADHNLEFFHPSKILCTDNAAMIGAAAYYDYIRGVRAGLDLNAVPNLKIGER
jgi:N6-L-threonylcarbamoyladenine synthase